eukprot:6794584-Prymnesium_polylepis.1
MYTTRTFGMEGARSERRACEPPSEAPQDAPAALAYERVHKTSRGDRGKRPILKETVNEERGKLQNVCAVHEPMRNGVKWQRGAGWPSPEPEVCPRPAARGSRRAALYRLCFVFDCVEAGAESLVSVDCGDWCVEVILRSVPHCAKHPKSSV